MRCGRERSTDDGRRSVVQGPVRDETRGSRDNRDRGFEEEGGVKTRDKLCAARGRDLVVKNIKTVFRGSAEHGESVYM